jgi:hypothetical protein
MCPEIREDPSTNDFLKKHISINQIKFQNLAGDASARRYVRIYNALDSYILMIFPKQDQKMGSNFLEIQAELLKYKVKVPEVLGFDMTLGYILLQDLGDLTLERRFYENQEFTKTLPYYFRSIDEILKIHHIPIDKSSNAPFFHIEFDPEKLLWELNYMKKNLLQDFFNLEMTEEFKTNLDFDFVKICEHLSKLPQVVCHRDYHSRNIMLHRDNTFVIDFQDARMGPCQYDLVSLLRDSYVDLTEEQEDILLKYYFEKMPGSITQGWDNFMANYNVQVLQRTLKACGSFSSFYNQKKDTRYIKHIQPTLLKTKKVLFEMDGLESMKMLFNEYRIEAIESVKL